MKFTSLVLLAAPVASLVPATSTSGRTATQLYGYVPDGLTKEQWAAMQKKEKEEKKNKNFGAGGARGFKSRSFNSFVEALEKGEADHLFAVDPRKVRSGEIALKDVPYMQRGGSWDNSDLAGKKGWQKTGFGMTAWNDGKAQKKRELDSDKKYNGLKPDIGIFGTTINWSGKGASGDDLAARAKKNGVSADQQMWRDSGALGKKDIEKMRKRGSQANINQPEKKFFGLF